MSGKRFERAVVASGASMEIENEIGDAQWGLIITFTIGVEGGK